MWNYSHRVPTVHLSLIDNSQRYTYIVGCIERVRLPHNFTSLSVLHNPIGNMIINRPLRESLFVRSTPLIALKTSVSFSNTYVSFLLHNLDIKLDFSFHKKRL